MGFDLPRPSLPLTPAETVGLDGAPVEPEPQPAPPVVTQREELSEAFEPKPAAPMTPLLAKRKVRTVSRAKAAGERKAKAAFTLRLDADRHLKLRLACAMQNRSAQQIVTEALDQFLAALPDLDGVAERVPAASNG